MVRRLLFLFIVFASLNTFTVRAAVAAPVQQDAPNPCQQADALFEAKAYQASLNLYNLLLEGENKKVVDANGVVAAANTETVTCAQVGITRIRALELRMSALYAQGYQDYQAGNIQQAREAFMQVVEEYPYYQDITGLLEKLIYMKDPVLLYKPVRGLADAGFSREARAQLQQIVADYPDITPPLDLYFLFLGPFSTRFWLAPVVDFFADVLVVNRYTLIAVLDFAELFVVLMTVVQLFNWKMLAWVRGRREVHFDILDFEQGPAQVEIGQGLAAIMRERLLRQEREQTVNRIDIVVGSAYNNPLVPVSVLESAAPRLKILADLINWFFPPRVLRVTGCGQMSETRGAGITLFLVDPELGIACEAETFWQDTYNPNRLPEQPCAADYVEIIEPAMEWLKAVAAAYRTWPN